MIFFSKIFTLILKQLAQTPYFFYIFFATPIAGIKKSTTFATQFRNDSTKEKFIKNVGAVVQSVRISACHAGGRGFESRPHRKPD